MQAGDQARQSDGLDYRWRLQDGGCMWLLEKGVSGLRREPWYH